MRDATHAAGAAGGGWCGRLSLDYRRDASGRTVAHDRHDGPLRVLKPMHPEGPGICHHVLVHPPGGIVGGDALAIDVRVHDHAHVLLTTPGATRFYRTAGARAAQTVHLHAAEGSRLEWLPLETLAYPGCDAASTLEMDLAPGAEVLGWDILALGLPASKQAFDRGRYVQRLALAQAWIEGGTIAAEDRRLLQSPLGLGGREVLATAWFAAGGPLHPDRRERLVEAARAVDAPEVPGLATGVTAPDERVVLARALAHRVEPVLRWLAGVRAAWRQEGWQLPAPVPRVWNT